MSDLFRKEVMEKQGQRLFGDVILSAPISHKAMTALLSLIVAGLIAVLFFVDYTRTETAYGSLVAKGDVLEAQVWVPSHAAGAIKQGQPVTLSYDAFPAPKFGTRKGIVSSVSKDITAHEDGAAFAVAITMESQSMNASGIPHPFKAGMAVSGNITLGKQKIWHWMRPKATEKTAQTQP